MSNSADRDPSRAGWDNDGGWVSVDDDAMDVDGSPSSRTAQALDVDAVDVQDLVDAYRQ